MTVQRWQRSNLILGNVNRRPNLNHHSGGGLDVFFGGDHKSSLTRVDVVELGSVMTRPIPTIPDALPARQINAMSPARISEVCCGTRHQIRLS
jgi:hypothetical protein